MSCETTTQYLNDFLDVDLDEEKRQEIQLHIKSCGACYRLLAREQELRAALRGLPVPALRADFVHSTLVKARQQHARHSRHWVTLGGAIAAGFVLFIAAGLLLMAPMSNTSAVPQVILAKGQLQDIKLVFNSKTEINGATFVVQLPGNVALKGFPHQQSISWKGRLKQGRNLLVLPVMATGPIDGDLITWIEHAESKKAFHLGIQIKEGNLSRSWYRFVDVA